MIDQADAEQTSQDVLEAFDEAWHKIEEANDLVRYGESLIQNTTLKNIIGRVIAELQLSKINYVRLAYKWDAAPELREIHHKDTEAARPIIEGEEHA